MSRSSIDKGKYFYKEMHQLPTLQDIIPGYEESKLSESKTTFFGTRYKPTYNTPFSFQKTTKYDPLQSNYSTAAKEPKIQQQSSFAPKNQPIHPDKPKMEIGPNQQIEKPSESFGRRRHRKTTTTTQSQATETSLKSQGASDRQTQTSVQQARGQGQTQARNEYGKQTTSIPDIKAQDPMRRPSIDAFEATKQQPYARQTSNQINHAEVPKQSHLSRNMKSVSSIIQSKAKEISLGTTLSNPTIQPVQEPHQENHIPSERRVVIINQDNSVVTPQKSANPQKNQMRASFILPEDVEKEKSGGNRSILIKEDPKFEPSQSRKPVIPFSNVSPKVTSLKNPPIPLSYDENSYSSDYMREDSPTAIAKRFSARKQSSSSSTPKREESKGSYVMEGGDASSEPIHEEEEEEESRDSGDMFNPNKVLPQPQFPAGKQDKTKNEQKNTDNNLPAQDNAITGIKMQQQNLEDEEKEEEQKKPENDITNLEITSKELEEEEEEENKPHEKSTSEQQNIDEDLQPVVKTDKNSSQTTNFVKMFSLRGKTKTEQNNLTSKEAIQPVTPEKKAASNKHQNNSDYDDDDEKDEEKEKFESLISPLKVPETTNVVATPIKISADENDDENSDYSQNYEDIIPQIPHNNTQENEDCIIGDVTNGSTMIAIDHDELSSTDDDDIIMPSQTIKPLSMNEGSHDQYSLPSTMVSIESSNVCKTADAPDKFDKSEISSNLIDETEEESFDELKTKSNQLDSQMVNGCLGEEEEEDEEDFINSPKKENNNNGKDPISQINQEEEDYDKILNFEEDEEEEITQIKLSGSVNQTPDQIANLIEEEEEEEDIIFDPSKTIRKGEFPNTTQSIPHNSDDDELLNSPQNSNDFDEEDFEEEEYKDDIPQMEILSKLPSSQDNVVLFLKLADQIMDDLLKSLFSTGI